MLIGSTSALIGPAGARHLYVQMTNDGRYELDDELIMHDG